MTTEATEATEEAKCVWCALRKPFRRDLCRACHRKALACRVRLPPRRHGGPRRWSREERLVSWLSKLPRRSREALVAALVKVPQ
jgi:hypothetical protein